MDITPQSILDFVLSCCTWLFEKFCDFFFDDLIDSFDNNASRYGNYFLNFFFSKFSSGEVSFNYISYFIGFCACLFFLKLVISLLRG